MSRERLDELRTAVGRWRFPVLLAAPPIALVSFLQLGWGWLTAIRGLEGMVSGAGSFVGGTIGLAIAGVLGATGVMGLASRSDPTRLVMCARAMRVAWWMLCARLGISVLELLRLYAGIP